MEQREEGGCYKCFTSYKTTHLPRPHPLALVLVAHAAPRGLHPRLRLDGGGGVGAVAREDGRLDLGRDYFLVGCVVVCCQGMGKEGMGWDGMGRHLGRDSIHRENI